MSWQIVELLTSGFDAFETCLLALLGQFWRTLAPESSIWWLSAIPVGSPLTSSDHTTHSAFQLPEAQIFGDEAGDTG